MQITFMTKLTVSLINELEEKGFKIGSADVNEDEITVLDFHKDNIEYNISISLVVGRVRGKYLKLTGFMKKRDQGDVGYQVEPILKEFKSGDRLSISYEEGNGFVVVLTKCLDFEFAMGGTDKEAVMVIANDIVDVIVKTGTGSLSVVYPAPASVLCIDSPHISVRDLDDDPIEAIHDPIVD